MQLVGETVVEVNQCMHVAPVCVCISGLCVSLEC
jgi:hypothetical protein